MQRDRGSCIHNPNHEKTRLEITDENCIHAGKVICDECNKFIRWASKREVEEEFGVKSIAGYLDKLETTILTMAAHTDISGEETELLLAPITKIRNERRGKESYLRWQTQK